MPLLTALLVLGCASEDYIRLYHTEEVAPSLGWEALQTLDFMGPYPVDKGVNFAVYSENAERVELLLFDDPESDLPTWQFPMTQQGAVWSVYVEGVGVGQHYGYIAWGPNWPYDEDWIPGTTTGFRTDVDEQGNRFNPNKLLFDPYARAIHRDHDWLAGSLASGPKRHELTYAAGSKSVIVPSHFETAGIREPAYAWSEHEDEWQTLRASGDHPGHDWTDLVVYEVHAKGLTANPASGVEFPGTYRGVGELAPYLADLGITAVELLPIHEKPLDGGYWGYNNLSFFAPENAMSASYQVTGQPLETLDEFKWMVDQLHQAGVEVIIDVVYNHTGEGGLWRERLYFETYEDQIEVNFDPKEVAGLYSYRGLDNASWYALSEDGQTYWNNTGVGNQSRPNHTPMRKLILDSLRFMTEELHVDGFRFDLAGILGEPDLNYNGWIDPSETVLQDIIDADFIQENNVRIIAEPWTAGGTGPGIGGFPVSSSDPDYGWGEWTPYFRDWWRSFVNDDGWALNSTHRIDGGAVMTAAESVYAWNGRKPYHTVNFVTAHDGFTMYDLMSYTEKQNGCGLLNPICCDDPLSVWCDDESGEENNHSRNWGDEATKRQMMRNLFVAMMISHGTPMILGGDEWMRTQYGNNNAYNIWADNEWNWHRWGEWQSTYAWHRARMHDFVRELIRFRLERTYAFSPADWGAGMPFSWKNESNQDMGDGDWSSRHLAIHYYNGNGYTEQPEILVLINMERSPVTFTLPSGTSWGRVIDTQSWFDIPGTIGDAGGGYFDENPDADPYMSANINLDAPVAVPGTSYEVPASAIVILEEQR
ncbi:MAG: glycosyl hydrolase [Alphaproteobacteria bacterium]|nr:glycosyl hydrolase [Alphaproteobacteria bacterium]MCB9796447.1 glycosyl hydrolase [Alphaproteobacteria bacterium]